MVFLVLDAFGERLEFGLCCFATIGVLGFLRRVDLGFKAVGFGLDLWCVLVLDLGQCFIADRVELLGFFLGEFLEEQERCLDGCARRAERVLGETDDGEDAGAVLGELADILEGGVVEDAFGEDDAEAAAGP